MKNVFKRFRILFIAYFLFIILWFLAAVFKTQLTPVFEGEKNLNLGTGFYTSWLASLSEDILFFGIIGILGLVLSTKLPQDENFNIRIDSLANGRKVGDRSRKFLNYSIRKLLVYNDSYSIKLIIKSINPTTKIAEVYAEFNNVCTNMCKDVIYPLNTNSYVMPTHEVNGDYGYVSHLQIHEEGNLDNHKTEVDGEIYKLTKTGFDKTIYFDLPANGAAIWKFCYCTYQLISGDRSIDDNWYYVKTSGFAENLNITVINRTNVDLSYDLEYMDRSSQDAIPVSKTDKLIKKAEGGKETVEKIVENI